MDAFLDLTRFLGLLLDELWGSNRQTFLIAAVVGVLLGGGAWWLARWVALNFNRHFDFKPQYHLYCGAAAALTVLFALLFAALQYTGTVARIAVQAWETSIRNDQRWSDDTFRLAYEAVYDLHDAQGRQIEDFSERPHPDRGLTTVIPTTTEAARMAAAETYARQAIAHFRSTYPLLSSVLWARSGIASDTIYADMQRFFAADGQSYDAEDAIRLAGREIRQQLDAQTPRVVLISRIVLVMLFLLVQAVTFTLLARSALADIREHPVPRLKGR